MIVATMEVRLLIRGALSLKDKRRAVSSLKARLQQTFNIAVAEVGALDDRRQSVFGIAAVGNEQRFLDGVLNKVIERIRRDREVELVDFEMEFF
jgi:uncharacterized protein YlxP (DUF503 family)